MKYDIDKDYDDTIAQHLKKVLGREPKTNELQNADTDISLATDTLWSLLIKLEERISALETK